MGASCLKLIGSDTGWEDGRGVYLKEKTFYLVFIRHWFWGNHEDVGGLCAEGN